MSGDYTFVVAGARDPDRLVVRVRRGAITDDLRSTQAAELRISLDGTTRIWSAAVEHESEDVVRLVHVFAADGSDVPEPAVLRVAAVIYTATGRRRAHGRLLQVSPRP
jgi:hypothetical protein